MDTRPELVIVGGGLAGAEAAWQASVRGVSVRLFEMRPVKPTPAHVTGFLAELVCSNSFRSNEPESAVGLLKVEMRRLNSLILSVAERTRVPAGSSLAVDRLEFAAGVTHQLESLDTITIVREELKEVDPDVPTIIATGPLTSESMHTMIGRLTDAKDLHFFDAIAPIVYGDSIDFGKAFKASRYEEGEGDYVNCPMSPLEYDRFYKALIEGDRTTLRDFEKARFFEGCLPIEEMAMRGAQTLLFGPMKPVGLVDPRTGKRPYAVVQLRQENRDGTLYNMVGFQTRLKRPEQEKVFRLIPGLEHARFARLGSVHRNTFIHGPRWVENTLQLKTAPRIFLAGQITGVEGYVESAAMGLLAGMNAARMILGLPLVTPPPDTALGALLNHVSASTSPDFQPMNVNFGLFPPLASRPSRKSRREAYARRAMDSLEAWIRET